MILFVGMDLLVFGECASGCMVISNISYEPISDIRAISAAMFDSDDELSEVASTA